MQRAAAPEGKCANIHALDEWRRRHAISGGAVWSLCRDGRKPAGLILLLSQRRAKIVANIRQAASPGPVAVVARSCSCCCSTLGLAGKIIWDDASSGQGEPSRGRGVSTWPTQILRMGIFI